MDEYDLVDGCAKEIPSAQRLLYNQFSKKMFGVCLRYAKDNEEAQDILQDGFVKVFNKIGKFKKEGSLEGWIRRIMVNTALDQIRKNKKESSHVEMDRVEFMLKGESYIIESLMAEDLLKMLQELPFGYRTVFNLFAIEGYSHKEIAEELGISENTSKSQFSRAKSFMKKVLEKNNY
jgi:RNA polymerase sigma-70 factor (ECF subfamily)